MGLDWHSATRRSYEERVELARIEYPDLPLNEALDQINEYGRPCEMVGAPKFGTHPEFATLVEENWTQRRQYAMELRTACAKDYEDFIDYWLNRTLEAELEHQRDLWDCTRCPLLSALSGADATESFFLGITVSSCDFRGKRIQYCSILDEELQMAAFQERDPDEMIAYADQLEDSIVGIPPGEHEDEIATVRQAAHWLRTCAEQGVSMAVSY